MSMYLNKSLMIDTPSRKLNRIVTGSQRRSSHSNPKQATHAWASSTHNLPVTRPTWDVPVRRSWACRHGSSVVPILLAHSHSSASTSHRWPRPLQDLFRKRLQESSETLLDQVSRGSEGFASERVAPIYWFRLRLLAPSDRLAAILARSLRPFYRCGGRALHMFTEYRSINPFWTPNSL
jgi:hypothetical protein